MKTEKYNVTGMTCAACQANVTRCVSKLPGVSEVNVSLLANNMTVSYDETAVTESDIVQAVSKIGYGASPVEQADAQGTAKGKSGFSKEWQDRQDRTLQNQKHNVPSSRSPLKNSPIPVPQSHFTSWIFLPVTLIHI